MIPLVNAILLFMHDKPTGGYYIIWLQPLHSDSSCNYSVSQLVYGQRMLRTGMYVDVWSVRPWLWPSLRKGTVKSRFQEIGFVSSWTHSFTIKLSCIVIPLAPVLLGDNNYHSSHWALDVIINWWFDNESSCQIVVDGNEIPKKTLWSTLTWNELEKSTMLLLGTLW